MVNNITGFLESGNDIRQSVNNISQSGEYNDIPFLAVLNETISGSLLNTQTESDGKFVVPAKIINNFADEKGNETNKELQADFSNILISELFPGTHNSNVNKNFAISGETKELVRQNPKQALSDLLSQNPDIKQKVIDFINTNQPLPENIENLLENYEGTEKYGVLKELLVQLESGKFQDNQKQSVHSVNNIWQIPIKESANEPAIAQSANGPAIAQSMNYKANSTVSEPFAAQPNINLKVNDNQVPLAQPAPEQANGVTSNSQATDNYFTFEPRTRQIRSNFNPVVAGNVSIGIDIPEDNNMAFVAGFIAGRQSYSKSGDKLNNTAAKSLNNELKDITNNLNLSADTDTDTNIDTVKAGKTELKGKLLNSDVTLEQTSKLSKNQEISNDSPKAAIRNVELSIGNEQGRIQAEDRNSAKKQQTNIISKTLPKMNSEMPDVKQQAGNLPDKHSEYILTDELNDTNNSGRSFEGNQGNSANFGNNTSLGKEQQKSANNKISDGEFTGLLRQQKSETIKSRVKAEETKPGTSQELQRIRISEFPAAALRLIKSTATNTVSSARLTLKPESLGTLNIKISMSGDVATLSIKADSREAMKSLEGQVGILREKLSQEGIKADNIELSYKEESNNQENLMQNNSDSLGRREFDETKREYIDSFRNEEFGEIANLESEKDSNFNSNKLYMEQGSSFVQYV